MNIFFNLLYIHYDCTVKSTIWNKKYLPIHYNVAWYIFSTMVALKPRGLTWQDHTPTHTFPVSTEMFFLMAIICLNISILTICNWVFLRNSACPVCWWHLHLFVWPAKMTTRFRTSQRAKAQLQKMAFFSILVWGTSGPLPIANCHLMIIVQTDLNWSILSI